MQRTVLAVLTSVALLVMPATAFAASPGTHGQPGQECGDFFSEGALMPQGFNTDGFSHAESMYAGSQPQNSVNPKSVSQYDIACFQQASH